MTKHFAMSYSPFLPLACLGNFFSMHVLNVLSFLLTTLSPPPYTESHIGVITQSSIKVFETNDEGRKPSESNLPQDMANLRWGQTTRCVC